MTKSNHAPFQAFVLQFVKFNIVTFNKYSNKFVFCYIFQTKPYFFKAMQCCHFCFVFS